MTGLCGRCLVIFDARSDVVACRGDEVEPCRSRRDARSLAKWAAAKLEDGWTINVDDSTQRFDPVTTWYGDPVCEFHLWYLADQERREVATGWRRRA